MDNTIRELKNIRLMSEAEIEIEFDKTLFELWEHYEPKMAIFQHKSGYYFRIDFNPKLQLLKQHQIKGYCAKYLYSIDTTEPLDKMRRPVHGYKDKAWRLIKILKY